MNYHRNSTGATFLLGLAFVGTGLMAASAQTPLQLDETCTVTIGNQTAIVRPDGTFFVRNISIFRSRDTGVAPQLYRVRATCISNGQQVTGQSDFFPMEPGETVFVGDVFPTELDPIPVRINVDSPAEFLSLGGTSQLTVTATLPDSSTTDVTARSEGTTYLSTNPRLLSVDENGVVTGTNTGSRPSTGTIAVLNEGNIATINITSVGDSNDFDNDGLPNDYEDLFGLNKFSNDANGDLDNDGLTNIQEFNRGTIPNNSDTDGDGIPDGQDNNPLHPEEGPPTITILSPQEGATVVEGQVINFDVDATDDGLLTTVELSADTGFSQSFTTPPFQAQVEAPFGSTRIVFSANASDSVGNTATETATVTVIPDPLSTIIGTVVDPDGVPVGDASVTVIGVGDSGTTDSTGAFSIPDVRTVQGDFRLRVDAEGIVAVSDRFPFNLGGVTNVGVIELLPERTSAGFEFALAFPQNLSFQTLTLFISGDDAADGTVEIPGLGFSDTFAVTPGSATTVNLPSNAAVTASDGIQDLGIRVTADAPVTVYGLNRRSASTDAFAALPISQVGGSYRVMAYTPLFFSQVAVVAADDNTTVTITPSINAGSRPAGVPYQIGLDSLQVYQLAFGDLTGTLIEADKPVSVICGNQCANVPTRSRACDHLVEQVPPVDTWGLSALTVPLATRLNGDTFRILADQDNTSVSIIGPNPETFAIDGGEFAERILQGNNRIVADKPILVAQYSNGTTFDGVTSDPFMMLVPPSEQFLRDYTFSTPGSGFGINFVNIVADTVDTLSNGVLLDGIPLNAGNFTPIPASSFSVGSIPLSVGSHTISTERPSGIYVYGFASFDSYGYPGGLGLFFAD